MAVVGGVTVGTLVEEVAKRVLATAKVVISFPLVQLKKVCTKVTVGEDVRKQIV